MLFRGFFPIALAAILAASACAGQRPPEEAPPPEPMATAPAKPRRSEPEALPRKRSKAEVAVVSATAYCLDGLTKSGTPVREGMVAADTAWLPLGSRIRVTGLGRRHNGVYTVTDTGPAIQGREIDIYMPSCAAAKAFGRKPARVTVLRRGPE